MNTSTEQLITEAANQCFDAVSLALLERDYLKPIIARHMRALAEQITQPEGNLSGRTETPETAAVLPVSSELLPCPWGCKPRECGWRSKGSGIITLYTCEHTRGMTADEWNHRPTTPQSSGAAQAQGVSEAAPLSADFLRLQRLSLTTIARARLEEGDEVIHADIAQAVDTITRLESALATLAAQKEERIKELEEGLRTALVYWAIYMKNRRPLAAMADVEGLENHRIASLLP